MKVITRLQGMGAAIPFKEESGAPCKENDPLIPVLIIPPAGRRCLSFGDDAFEPEPFGLQKGFEDFLVPPPWDVFEQVFYVHGVHEEEFSLP